MSKLSSWKFFAISLNFLIYGLCVKTCSSDSPETVTFEGNVNVNTSFRINSSAPHSHIYRLNTSEIDLLTNFRIETNVKENWETNSVDCPLIFAQQQLRSSRSWAFPMIVEADGSRYTLWTGGFTVCLDEYQDLSISKNGQVGFIIFVSTCSKDTLEYSLKITLSQTGFEIPGNEEVTATVSPTMNRFYRYIYPAGVDVVTVNVQSIDTICMTVAVQSPTCQMINMKSEPQSTSGNDDSFLSLWQDMTTVAIIPVKKNDFPNGFFLGFEVHGSSHRCEAYSGVNVDPWQPLSAGTENPLQKNITINIKENFRPGGRTIPLCIPYMIIGAILTMTLIIYSVCACVPHLANRRCGSDQQPIILNDELDQSDEQQSSQNPSTSRNVLVGDNELRRSNQHGSTSSVTITESTVEDYVFAVPNIETTSVPDRPTRDNRNNDRELNGWVTIERIMKKKKLKKPMKKLHLLILSLGIFYTLPTVQLLYTYLEIASSTGQRDLCYRNYLCVDKAAGLDDFNHIYSNIVYVVLGLVFCGFVLHYHGMVEWLEEERSIARIDSGEVIGENENVSSGHGVIHQFGVFYALGLALSIEGLLSAVYHVCPTELNYQFDTSFMYILASLCIIRIYQFRHPDPILPHNTFVFLAVVVLISVGDILLGKTVYKFIILVGHVLTVSLVALYYVGCAHIEDSETEVTGNSSIFRRSRTWATLSMRASVLCAPQQKARLFFVIPFLLFNISICVWQIASPFEFQSYLVYVFVGSMMIYFLYYFIMKIILLELFHRLAIQPLVYLTCSSVLGYLALLNFREKRYDTNLSPAQSRVLNKPCELAGFYDTHDLWHFLSASAIFFFFMTLLTLDDAILRRPRNQIVVF